MNFYDCIHALYEGKKIKLPLWKKAYWFRNEDGELMNCYEEGEICPAYDHPRALFWLMRSDWEIVEESSEDIFSFSKALDCLKEGKKVARKGWNGKDMFLFLAEIIEISTEADLSCVSNLEGDLTLPAIVLKTADNSFSVGWLASQTDMLADDWYIV